MAVIHQSESHHHCIGTDRCCKADRKNNMNVPRNSSLALLWLMSSCISIEEATAFTFVGLSRRRLLPHFSLEQTSSLYARRGAMSRRKKQQQQQTSSVMTTASNGGGFGREEEKEATTSKSKQDVKETTTTTGKSIYSLPALYDLAFGYRNFELEVHFLLDVHKNLVGDYPARILELAAGPARHSIAVLVHPKNPVSHVLAVDTSQEMLDYATKEVADVELPVNKRSQFEYMLHDVREPLQDVVEIFDSAWILLGSLQHLTTNQDVVSCFQSAHEALGPKGTLILELPHPRETFSMVECTRNGWQVPLEDEDGQEYGELDIVWGDDDDYFDPIRQVRNFTVSMHLNVPNDGKNNEALQSVREIVPMRMFTAQEMDALARCSGFRVAAMYGALSEDVAVNDEDEAFRLVCVLCKDS